MKFILWAGIGLLFASCANTKKTGEVFIPKGQHFFQFKKGTVGDPTDKATEQTLKQGVKARLTLPATPSDFLQIKFTQSISGATKEGGTLPAISSDPANAGSYAPLFPRSIPQGVNPDESFTSTKFTYYEYKPVFQTLTIPIKFRPGIRDTIGSTASAAFNVGFAYTFKFTANTYKRLYWNNAGTTASLGHHFTKFTYAFGPFLGPTVVDLKSGNTDGKAKKDRSAIGATFGAFAVVGYNEFNAGLALGIDKTFGSEPGSWIYNGKPWIGIVVAIDIIK